MLEACVVPACIYGLGTVALTERQEEKIQTAENNWIRRMCKVTQEDRMKMKELREEICMNKTPKDESSLKQNEMGRKCAKMGEDRLSKREWKAE